MASEAQVIANRANASKSTGPCTEAGKARSRMNATTHGLAGSHLPEELTLSDVYQEHLKQLEDYYQPDTPFLKMSLQLAVGAFVQSTTAFDMLTHEQSRRKNFARSGWEFLQENEAMTLMAKLGNKPLETLAELRESHAGCLLLIDRWKRLRNIAEKLGQWTENHIQSAFELLGVPKHLRDDTSQVVPMQAITVGSGQMALTDREIAKLETMISTYASDADEFARQGHFNGPAVPLTPTILRLIRYQSEASRRYTKHIKPLVLALKSRTGSKNSRQDSPPTLPTPPIPDPVQPSAEDVSNPAADTDERIELLRSKMGDAVAAIAVASESEDCIEICQGIRNEYASVVEEYLELTGESLYRLNPNLVFVFMNHDFTEIITE